MKFISTNEQCEASSFVEAVITGLAPDGGLYIPEEWPEIDWTPVQAAVKSSAEKDFFYQAALTLLTPFFSGTRLEKQLFEVIKGAFDFPLPMRAVDNETFLLELFHGPTCAFKDFGARFLAQVLDRSLEGLGQKKLILVATSGDTGGAVASAFSDKSRAQVAVLFPEKGVSPLQKMQLTCWGKNVQSFAVRGSFDDCQRMVKGAFSNSELQKTGLLTSANSINIGRLLPQMTYYAAISWRFYLRENKKISFIVPTGNMGNVVAALYARELGCPIDGLAISTNANQTLAHYFATGDYKECELQATLANAMDVASPSNFSRYEKMKGRHHNSFIEKCRSVSDQEINECIRQVFSEKGIAICPHTATAMVLRKELSGKPWCVVSTAHPVKFKEIVEPQIKQEIEWPDSLRELEKNKCSFESLDVDVEGFCKIILDRYQ